MSSAYDESVALNEEEETTSVEYTANARVVKLCEITRSVLKDLGSVCLANFGACIKLEGYTEEGENSNMWVRLENRFEGLTYTISDVTLAKKFRRKGYMTRLYKAVKASGCVDSIMVSNIITPEMVNWCEKMGMRIDSRDSGFGLPTYKFCITD